MIILDFSFLCVWLGEYL